MTDNINNNKMDHLSDIQNLKDFQLPKGFRGASALKVQLWWAIQSTLFAWSPQFLYGWRRALLRLFGAKIGEAVIVRPTAKITYPWKVEIGDFSWIGDRTTLYSLGPIKIGANSVISQNSYLCTGTHDYSSYAFSIYAKEINIGNKCWIASDVFIHPGVSIHHGAVVAARSTVMNDLEMTGVYAGTPAKFIRDRERN